MTPTALSLGARSGRARMALLWPIAIAAIAPPPAAPSTPLLPTTQYVSPAVSLPAAPALPIISAPPIPAPLAILGSTVFVDLADPPPIILRPIFSAPILPPPVAPTPLLPRMLFVAVSGPLGAPGLPILIRATAPVGAFSVPAHQQHQARSGKPGNAGTVDAGRAQATRRGANTSTGVDPQ